MNVQANERRRDNIKSSLIGWARAQNDPCTHFWMSVVLCSWVTPLVNIAEGNPTWQSSQWSDAAARLAVDGNDNPDLFAGSCSHTTDSDITEPPVWAVDLGHDLTDVYYVEVSNRDYLEGKDLSNEWQIYTCFPLVSFRPFTIFLVLLCGYQIYTTLSQNKLIHTMTHPFIIEQNLFITMFSSGRGQGAILLTRINFNSSEDML